MQGQETMANGRLAGIGCGLLAALIWSSFPVVTRLGVTHSTLDSYDIAFIRFVVSGTLMLPVLLRGGLDGLGVKPILLMVAGVGAPYILVVAGALSRAPVGCFALTPGSMIAFTAALGSIVIRSALTTAQKVGIATVLLGMGVAASDAISNSVGWLAIALFVLGGLLWAIYNLTTKRYGVSALRAAAIVAVGSVLLYSPFYLWYRGLTVLHAPVAAIAIQAFFQGVMVSILGLYFFNKGVAILGPAIGATFAALVPLFATVEAAFMLDEKPHALTLLGIGVVSIGMIVSVVNHRDIAERLGFLKRTSHRNS